MRGQFIQSSIEIRIANFARELETASDDALTALTKQGHDDATARDIKRMPLGQWEKFLASDVFYRGSAAARVLTARHGNEYVLDVLGYRQPNTLLEKLSTWWTGMYPRKE